MRIRQKTIGFIYKITSPTGKIYIGQTIDIKTRKCKYQNANCKNQTRLYNSIKKYGWENHSFEILEEIKIENLSEKEIYYIKYFDSFKKGLNCTIGGEGNSGRKLTKETREKMKKSAIGKKQSKETIEKRVAKLKGKKRSQEFKQRLSIIKKGRKLSEETKEKLRLINLGKQTPISIPCKITNLKTKQSWEAPSITKLSKICNLSVSTIKRIKIGKVTKNTNHYIVEYGK